MAPAPEACALGVLPAGNRTNLFGIHEYDYKCSYFGGKPALSQAAGWVIVIGFGAFFSVFTSLLVFLDYKFGGTQKTSEQFNSAGRSIKVGLTACDIVSKWTWAATLLQSSNVAYKFGVSGPFWYASGATIQVLLFAVLAIEIKRKAPTAHTILEIIQTRWGNTAHIVFFVFCLLTNIVVTSMLILGGASVVNALTGMNLYAAAFLIPMGVVLYTAHGGLKATFIASWVNTTIIYIALCTFTFLVYAGGKDLGSPSKVFDQLMRKDDKDHIVDNRSGSSLTMFSKSGLIFGVINIIGNFGTVFVDQSYWQSAIAAKPSATYKGYLLGGLCWFAVPFSMATAMGLGARAMDLPITIAESNNGLVPPAVAVHLMGKSGAFLLVLQLFVAVISTASAEQIAVSSLVAYDIYRSYFNKKATGAQIVFISRIVVVAYGVLSGVMAIILFKLEVSLGWVYLFMGIVVGSAVAPIYFALTWNGCTAKGAITGAIVGQVAAVAVWLGTAQALSGEITLDTTGADYPMLAGNLVAIFLSAIVTAAVSMTAPQNYDWAGLKEIPVVELDGSTNLAEDGEDSPQALNKAYKWTLLSGGGISLVMIIVWPVLTLPIGVFTKGYFYFWVIIAMVWGLLAGAACFFLPIWEARESIISVVTHFVSGKAVVAEAPVAAGDKVVDATKATEMAMQS